MEKLSSLLALCEGNRRWITLTSGQLCEALMFSLLLAWTHCQITVRVGDGFRPHDPHVTSL